MIYFGGQTLTFLDFRWRGIIYNDVWSSVMMEMGWTELTNDAGWHPRGQIRRALSCATTPYGSSVAAHTMPGTCTAMYGVPADGSQLEQRNRSS
jgi:hypothetical protein